MERGTLADQVRVHDYIANEHDRTRGNVISTNPPPRHHARSSTDDLTAPRTIGFHSAKELSPLLV